jgi:hypothetical protein
MRKGQAAEESTEHEQSGWTCPPSATYLPRYCKYIQCSTVHYWPIYTSILAEGLTEARIGTFEMCPKHLQHGPDERPWW